MGRGLSGLAALFVAGAFLGCGDRCEDRGQAAMQAVLPQLNQAVVSNLVREASACIANSSADIGGGPFYMPSVKEAPIAHGLKPESGSEVKFSMGPSVVVHTRRPSAPYMAIRVPVHTGSGVCLWG